MRVLLIGHQGVVALGEAGVVEIVDPRVGQIAARSRFSATRTLMTWPNWSIARHP
jgi:hypothetical protein